MSLLAGVGDFGIAQIRQDTISARNLAQTAAEQALNAAENTASDLEETSTMLNQVVKFETKSNNLIKNGYGELQNNDNFNNLNFSKNCGFGTNGFFYKNAITGILSVTSDQYININQQKRYRLSLDYKATKTGSGNLSGLDYLAFVCYDAGKNYIDPIYCYKYLNAIDTTLAQALNPGDTIMHLSNATGWQNAGQTYERQIVWWINGLYIEPVTGFSYPAYTYSRNASLANNPNGLWQAGAISGNNITISAWNGPLLPAGTHIRNATSGWAFNYYGLVGAVPPTTLTKYSVNISGFSSSQDSDRFRNGTFFIRPALLRNLNNVNETSDIVVANWELLEYEPSDSVVNYTPVSSSDSKVSTGQITYDENYMYVKTASGTIKKIALTSF